jgi:hypothetical protein
MPCSALRASQYCCEVLGSPSPSAIPKGPVRLPSHHHSSPLTANGGFFEGFFDGDFFGGFDIL